MPTLRRGLIPFAPAVLLLSMIICSVAPAEIHWQHTRTRCCIPGYRYTHDDREVSTRVIAIADPAREVVWHYPDRNQTLRQKTFHFPVRSLVADQVRLENMGVTLYSDGRLAATGRVVHDGGPQGDLLGNRVIVRLQAYAGLAGRQGELADTPVVWQTENQFRISRDHPQIVSLAGGENLLEPHVSYATPPQKGFHHVNTVWPRLAVQFDEITHLELELAYLGDR